MLSETWRLLQALDRSNLSLQTKHRRVFTPGRTFPCLRVRLGSRGTVVAVEEVGADDWPSWTVMEGNQNSFPVMRLTDPLLHLNRGDETWKRLQFDDTGKRRKTPSNADWIEILEGMLPELENATLLEKARELLLRLRRVKAKEIYATARKGGNDLKSLKSLAVFFRQGSSSPEAFLRSIARMAVARLKSGHLSNSSLKTVEQLLVGKGPPKPDGKRPPSTVQIAFDVLSMADDCISIYGQAMKKKVIEFLPQDPFANQKSCSIKEGNDAFTGESAEIEYKNFPPVELPTPSFQVINGSVGRGRHGKGSADIGRKKFPLASMFSEARCNYRYGMTDAKVFPVSKTQAMKLKEALELITADERRGRTWQHIASGRLKKEDLLIVYVEDKPDIDAKTAAFFGCGPVETATKFEEDAKAVCAALHGEVRQRPTSRLNLFLISETSKGQAQVVLSESLAVGKVLDSAVRWEKAVTENLPPVMLNVPPLKKGQHVVSTGPLIPYPDQVVRLLSYQWVRDGASSKGKDGRTQEPKQALIGPSFSEVLSVMLRTEAKWKPAAEHLLYILIQRLAPLFIGVFGAAHGYGPRQAAQIREPLFDYPRNSRLIALRGVAVIGILLDALNSQKEVYMENAPYLVGQILALTDTLHKDYCVVVRKGCMPNSLIGTSLMRRALDTPAGAIADLAGRILEYIRWAKTNNPEGYPNDSQERIAAFEAKKKLRQYEPLAARLGDIALPNECTDIMKAQLLLGFLATPAETSEAEKGKE